MKIMNFDEAKALAEKSIREQFPDEDLPLLEEQFREEEFGWMFFPNTELTYPANSFFKNEAIVITKNGTVRFVPNYLKNLKKLESYVKELGEYIKKHNE
jgi:hypothetical protein